MVLCKALGELLLLLGACPVLLEDYDHLASVGIFRIDSALSAHFDDFPDLVLRLLASGILALTPNTFRIALAGAHRLLLRFEDRSRARIGDLLMAPLDEALSELLVGRGRATT